MGNSKQQGPACGAHHATQTDTGTMCRQKSSQTGVIGVVNAIENFVSSLEKKADSYFEWLKQHSSAPGGHISPGKVAGTIRPKVFLTQEQCEAILEDGKQMTGEAEGLVLHPYVPEDDLDISGVTIGRGCDMKERTQDAIKTLMRAAGISAPIGNLMSKASGLYGSGARAFLKKNPLSLLDDSNDRSFFSANSYSSVESIPITSGQAEKLFDKDYEWYTTDTQRIATKNDVQEAYGNVVWGVIHPAIRAILVDLRFRGDYSPASRRIIESYVASNKLQDFIQAMDDQNNWKKVPADRFNRRNKFLLKYKTH